MHEKIVVSNEVLNKDVMQCRFYNLIFGFFCAY